MSMLDSYFFIPGNKPKYLEKINSIQADYIVIDLEDAVSVNAKQIAFDMVLNLEIANNHFIRIPLLDHSFSSDQIQMIARKFQGRIVVPKISHEEHITGIVDIVGDIAELKMIFLVEHPLAFINLPSILQKHHHLFFGIGFGSHDFCSTSGIKHTLENLEFYKRQLILYSKAYQIAFIDGVDLDLMNFDSFERECLFAFENGASGKFLIHPKQLEKIKAVPYFSEKELIEMNRIYAQIKDIDEKDIEVYTIDGKVYEKPHINRIKSILQRINN